MKNDSLKNLEFKKNQAFKLLYFIISVYLKFLGPLVEGNHVSRRRM